MAAKKGVFIDVGANTGQTLRKLLSIDPERAYVGFEPQIDCSFYISQFIMENGLAAHTILPIGLSNRSGILPLLKRTGRSDQTASTIEGFRPAEFYTARDFIYVAQGDDITSGMNLDEISTIKIDVEGGELEVIKGFRRTLLDKSPFLFFEVLNNFLAATGKELDETTRAFREARNVELMQFLHGAGYEVFNIRPDDKLVEISEFVPGRTGDLSVIDYVAIHHSHKAAFLDKYSGTVISLQDRSGSNIQSDSEHARDPAYQ